MYYLLTVSILHQSALLEILPVSSTTKTKILPTMTEYKLRITSKAEKERILQDEYNLLLEEVDVRSKRSMAHAREKGSRSWLTALPIKSLGYTLNKREFQNSIFLRYDWRIPNKPSYCLCGVNNDINHALSCKKGGYVMMRHNCIRDLEAEIMQEVCSDVRIEPETCHLTTTWLDEEWKQRRKCSSRCVRYWSLGAIWKTVFRHKIYAPECAFVR